MKSKAVVENGFKETEIGLIPEDWQVKGFEECIDKERISRDIKIPQGKYKKVGRYPIVDQGASFVAGYTDDKSKLYSGCLPVIVFGDHTRIFKFVDLSFSLGADGIKLIQPKDFLNPKYFYYYLCSLTIESKGYNRHYKYLKEKIIAFPEKTEQQKIAFVLSKIQQAIEQQHKIIETTRELKKSLMNKFFTEGLHGEEQKKTEIGLIPKRWDVIEVDNLGEIITGTTPPTNNKKYYTGGGFQFISPVDLGDTKYVYKTKKEINLEGLRVSRVLPKDAVLIVCIGSTTGKVGLTFKDKSTTNQQINTVICKDEFNPHFIYYLLNFECNYIRSLSTPSPVPILSKGKFQRAKIPIVKNKQEQDKIAEILSAIDEKIEKAEYRKQTLQALFKTMLNQLMTGKVRVKDFDFEVN
jgi:type I restriction enzyme, S subunit